MSVWLHLFTVRLEKTKNPQQIKYRRKQLSLYIKDNFWPLHKQVHTHKHPTNTHTHTHTHTHTVSQTQARTSYTRSACLLRRLHSTWGEPKNHRGPRPLGPHPPPPSHLISGKHRSSKGPSVAKQKIQEPLDLSSPASTRFTLRHSPWVRQTVADILSSTANQIKLHPSLPRSHTLIVYGLAPAIFVCFPFSRARTEHAHRTDSKRNVMDDY